MMKEYIILTPEVDPYVFKDDGRFPNNGHLAVLHYKKCLELPADIADAGDAVESLFLSNDWKNSWRDSIYDYLHYHSVTHEVMGIYAGFARVELGGEHQIVIELNKGDVLIIPAGVAHKKVVSSDNFICLGAYPAGKQFDINYGKGDERPQADKNIASLPLPLYDPVFGKNGLLFQFWKR